MASNKKLVWLDVDPGHDDAVAILLATQLDDIELVGISTVHGNATSEWTLKNATRLLLAFAPHRSDLVVYPGASSPLLRASRADPEIHGVDGLGGVIGLYAPDEPLVEAALTRSVGLKAIEGMAHQVSEAMKAGRKINMVTCGPMTNLALFLCVYPELIGGIEQICFMGGGVGVGNRSPVAEFNILCDPEAAQIVINVDIPKVMIPLNVTHKAILTNARHARVKGHDSIPEGSSIDLLLTTSPFRTMMSTMLSFFSQTYEHVFGFTEGPPLHDPLTLAYISQPEIFTTKRYRVDVDCSDGLGVGQTVVDVWNYRKCDNSWGKNGKNVLVAEDVDVDQFFNIFFYCIEKCDKSTPLNLGPRGLTS
ncbi:nucleoside hydrolase [Clavulina sp. PMI_390]|nr:nucleoside hydrolase [Clavulina sp. PMI_390]